MINLLQKEIYNLSKKCGDNIGFDLPYFIKNGFWVFLRQAVGLISGLALSIAFARLATQEVFGQYQFILSILYIVSIISIPGLNTSLAQAVARGNDGDYRNIVRKSFFWSLLGVPLLLVIGGYYYIYQSHPLGMALMISSIFFPFFYAPNSWDSFLQGKSRFDVSTKFSSIQSIINTIATVVVIFFNRESLIPIVIVYLVSYTFFNGYFYFKSLKYIENNKKCKDTIKYGLYITKINFLILISENIDKLAIGIILKPEDLAVYSIVSLVAIKIKEIFRTISSMFFPKLSNSEISLKGLIVGHKKIFSVTFLLSLFVALIFYEYIPFLNKILFSDKYEAYAYLSKIFTATVFLGWWVTFLGYYIYARKNKFAIFISSSIFNVIKIILNFVLIIKFGLVGAIISFNISIIVLFLFYIIGIIYQEEYNKISKPVTL